jgi:ParB family chromosome partitioning protein
MTIVEIKDIKMDLINISSFNTRKDLAAGTEDTSLDDLADSIREKGLLNPIMVQKKDDGTYELIVGQRRFLACKKLGWNTIPAIIREKMDDTDATILSLIENVHRADMSPIDKARAYQKIYEKYQNYDKVARETGVSISTIKKYLTLLKLAPSIQNTLTTSEGPAGIGTLSKLAETFSSHEDQEKVLEAVGGFKQSVQLEIIKKSEGKIENIQGLREEALEGAFDTVLCHGIEDCNFIPETLKEPIMNLIKTSKKKGKNISFKELVKSLK